MSLIEVLTAVLIFSIGLIALVGLQTRAVRYSMSAEDTNRAALLANEVVSRMQLKRSLTLSDTELSALQTRVASASEGLPSGQLTIGEPTAKTAPVTITWTPPGGTENRYTTSAVLP